MLAQQGNGVFTPDGTKVAFDGPEGQRALQLLVDVVHRDGADSLQRPALPSGVEPLATPLLAAKWANSVLFGNMERAEMSPKEMLVTDLTPEYSGKTTASAYLGGTWIMASKTTKDPSAAIELALRHVQCRSGARRNTSKLSPNTGKLSAAGEDLTPARWCSPPLSTEWRGAGGEVSGGTIAHAGPVTLPVLALDGQRGEFVCVPKTIRPCTARSRWTRATPHHLLYQDATRPFVLGYEANWLWALAFEPDGGETLRRFVDRIAAHGFNHVFVNT